MMTEDDLHTAFALLERAADQRGIDEHIGRTGAAVRDNSHRRWVAPAAVAASVALLAGAAVIVTSLSEGDGHGTAARPPQSLRTSAGATTRVATSTPPGPSTSTAHAVAALHTMPWRNLAFTVTAPGLTTSGTVLDTDEEVLNLVGPSGSYVVRVFTDQAGPVYQAAGAVPLTVAGRPGVYARLTSDSDGGQVGVAWQYAPDAWASVARIDARITSAQGVRLAQTVRVGVPSVARTPVAFAPVAGLRTSLWLTGYGNDANRAGQHGYARWNALYNLELGGVQLVVTADDIPDGLLTSGDATSIHGHSAHVQYTSTDHLVSIDWNGHTVNVEESVDGSTGRFSLSRAQLIDVARSVTLVDHPADTGTWHDAASALPS